MTSRSRARPGPDAGAVKTAVDLAQLVGRYVQLTRKPGDRSSLWGPCPFHKERTASFHVVEGRGFYHCFGCGAHGDAIAFVMAIERLSFAEALARLTDRTALPDPGELARIKAERQELERRDRQASIAKAKRLWSLGQRLGRNDLASRYLEARGLPGPWPGSLRFVSAVRHRGSPEGDEVPALLAAASLWPDRHPVAVQATALAEPGVKATVDPPRWTVGALRGAAVRLAPWKHGQPIILTEGTEDGLAVLRGAPDAGAVWAVLGVTQAPHVRLPEGAELILMLDADAAGRLATERAVEAHAAAGHRVLVASLPDGMDPNSALLADLARAGAVA